MQNNPSIEKVSLILESDYQWKGNILTVIDINTAYFITSQFFDLMSQIMSYVRGPFFLSWLLKHRLNHRIRFFRMIGQATVFLFIRFHKLFRTFIFHRLMIKWSRKKTIIEVFWRFIYNFTSFVKNAVQLWARAQRTALSLMMVIKILLYPQSIECQAGNSILRHI